MTRDSNRKRTIRQYAAENRVNYTEAARQLRAQAPAGGQQPSTPAARQEQPGGLILVYGPDYLARKETALEHASGAAQGCVVVNKSAKVVRWARGAEAGVDPLAELASTLDGVHLLTYRDAGGTTISDDLPHLLRSLAGADIVVVDEIDSEVHAKVIWAASARDENGQALPGRGPVIIAGIHARTAQQALARYKELGGMTPVAATWPSGKPETVEALLELMAAAGDEPRMKVVELVLEASGSPAPERLYFHAKTGYRMRPRGAHPQLKLIENLYGFTSAAETGLQAAMSDTDVIPVSIDDLVSGGVDVRGMHPIVLNAMRKVFPIEATVRAARVHPLASWPV